MRQTAVHSTHPFLDSLGQVLEGVPSGDSIILQADFNAHVGNDIVIWKGVTGKNSLYNLNLSGAQLLYSCDPHPPEYLKALEVVGLSL